MRKPERIENALKELEQIHGNIELIEFDLSCVDQLGLSDDETTAKEKELEKALRKEHGNLAYWAFRYIHLMRNNDRHFSEVRARP